MEATGCGAGVEALPSPLSSAPGDPAHPEDGNGILSISGSFTEFAPDRGGDTCYVPGSSQTFCFWAESQTGNWSFAFTQTLRLPADWQVLDARDAGLGYVARSLNRRTPVSRPGFFALTQFGPHADLYHVE